MTREDYIFVIAEKDKIIKNISFEMDEIIGFLNFHDMENINIVDLKKVIVNIKKHNFICPEDEIYYNSNIISNNEIIPLPHLIPNVDIVSFEDICNIPLPPVTNDENILLSNEDISNLEYCKKKSMIEHFFIDNNIKDNEYLTKIVNNNKKENTPIIRKPKEKTNQKEIVEDIIRNIKNTINKLKKKRY